MQMDIEEHTKGLFNPPSVTADGRREVVAAPRRPRLGGWFGFFPIFDDRAGNGATVRFFSGIVIDGWIGCFFRGGLESGAMVFFIFVLGIFPVPIIYG